jgi:hypothetical protein
MDLSIGYKMPESTLKSLEFEYLNEIAAYMLHALAESQSMGKLLFAFKNVRNMEKFLEENAAPPGGRQPLLTRETMAYAISLSVSCVCLHSNDEILKGRASAAYERAMSDLEQMPDSMWHSLLHDVLVQYVTLVTNPEGPAPSVPTLTRQEIIQRDNARKQARAAAIAAATAANDGSGDADSDAQADANAGAEAEPAAEGDANAEAEAATEGEAAEPAAAKAAGGGRKPKLPAAAAAEVTGKRGSRR